MEMVWGHSPDLPNRTLDTHLSSIGSHLNLRRENGLLLSSVYGFGYRLQTIARLDDRPIDTLAP